MAQLLAMSSGTSTSLRVGRLRSPKKSSQRKTNDYTEAEASHREKYTKDHTATVLCFLTTRQRCLMRWKEHCLRVRTWFRL